MSRIVLFEEERIKTVNSSRFKKGHNPWNKGLSWKEQGVSNEDKNKKLSNLRVNGKISVGNVSNTTTATSLYRNNTTGELQTSSSDIRLKENVIEIEQSLSKVTKLRGVYFNWKEDGTKEKQIGLIAQEVEEFFPKEHNDS